MNDVIQNIYRRRAVRRYKDIVVEKALIDEVIAAGKMAPSAKNEQSWKFYVLTDRENIARLCKEIAHVAYRFLKDMSLKEVAKMTLSFFHFSAVKEFIAQEDHVFYGAPVVIFITAPEDDEWGPLNTGMCAQNMMLAAHSLGLATCPVGFARLAKDVKDYHLLKIGEHERLEIAVVLGYGDEQPEPHPRKENNILYL